MKSVLITGGTGSFGRAFTSRLLKDNTVERICIYSHSEHTQAEMRESLNDERLRWFIGDVRDRDRLRRAMEGVDIVVHAAALKRIEVGHYCPDELCKTNINGSINVIDAAAQASVSKVLLTSTDKAYMPCSPYGFSKAMAESLFINANNIHGEHGPQYIVVRYGNIWGSNGSVVPKWKSLKKSGINRVSCTNTECTRFFMTLNQSVDFVLDNLNNPPEYNKISVPELPAYRLGDLAEAMEVEVDVTGLPQWEKLHECMGDGNCSKEARRMSIEELKSFLKDD